MGRGSSGELLSVVLGLGQHIQVVVGEKSSITQGLGEVWLLCQCRCEGYREEGRIGRHSTRQGQGMKNC